MNNIKSPILLKLLYRAGPRRKHEVIRTINLKEVQVDTRVDIRFEFVRCR